MYVFDFENDSNMNHNLHKRTPRSFYSPIIHLRSATIRITDDKNTCAT
jgi:hypothetical protein